MPVRALALAALVAVTLATPVPDSQATESAPVAAAVAGPDSLDLVAYMARTAHQAAWALREAGDYAAALGAADGALLALEEALRQDLGAARRRELVELRSKLEGNRDAIRRDLASRGLASHADSTIDQRVLNAPAVEPLQPQFNADVYRHIRFFTGVGRSTFERWLKRSGRYMELFRHVLRREGMPPDLVHLVFVESGFNVHARSVSAAVGPWQFLRSTATLWGLTVNQWLDERKDPEKSTVAAARYLRHLYSIFGDWPLALASYNAGEGRVLRAIKSQGTANFWDLRLPKQTEEYVPAFMAVLAIAREPEKYGFEAVELDEPMDFDEVALKGTVDLRAVARLADCSYEELRLLNPAVLRHAAPGNDGVTTLRVPDGKAEAILSKLASGAALPAADLTVKHRVRRGETLRGIASQYHVDATRLARENGLGRERPLRRGMVLTIRSHVKPAVKPAELAEGDPRASTAYVPERAIKLPASLDGESDAEGRLTVTVRRGETLAKIASQHGVTVADIVRWNRLASAKVATGTRLKIRTAEAASDPTWLAADSARAASFDPPRARKRGAAAAAGSRAVVVQRGDTLSAIASRNGTTVSKLKRVNGLDSDRIRVGQRLKIPA